MQAWLSATMIKLNDAGGSFFAYYDINALSTVQLQRTRSGDISTLLQI